jgi:hypothetical protein
LFNCNPALHAAADPKRLGHALSGSLTLDVYTHAEWPENVEAAKLAGEAIEKAVNSFSLTANQEKGLWLERQKLLQLNNLNGCGGQI